MEIEYQNYTVQEEISKFILSNGSLLKRFSGKTILVTGATGLVARILIFVLLAANQKYELDLMIIAVARNKGKANRLFGTNMESKSLKFIYQDVRNPINIDEPLDFIFHAAAITDSKSLIEIPVEAFETQVIGMINILNLAKLNSAKVVYLSSMEIYGQPFVEGRAHEEDLGYVDPLISRNGYPEGKRSNEFLGAAFYHEYNVPVVSARLAQTFGPGILKDDKRVFSQFIHSAINKQDIVLYTDGKSVGNYCYLYDTIGALLLLSVKGVPGESYNVVNEETTTSIKEMAVMVSGRFGNGVVKIEIPEKSMGFAKKVNLRLSSDKIRRLGWRPTLNLEEMFKQTIQSIK